VVDRGLAWEQALELFHATKASGADAYFLTAKRQPWGYVKDHPFRQVTRCNALAVCAL
jgi:hypothetical protein